MTRLSFALAKNGPLLFQRFSSYLHQEMMTQRSTHACKGVIVTVNDVTCLAFEIEDGENAQSAFK